MIYEVDNRYPEVAEPFEKVRGAHHHRALYGKRSSYAARRAIRANNLKRSFWTSAVAVITVIALLMTPSRALEAFTEPEIRIVSAYQTQIDADTVNYVYSVDLNSADSVDVTIVARTEDGEIVGTAGPFHHDSSGTSELQLLQLTKAVGLSEITLEALCTYSYEGEEHKLQTDQKVDLEWTPGTEPVTEPVTEPDTEPVTEPVTETDTEPVTEPVTEPTEPTETEPTEPTETEPTEPTETEPTPTTPTETFTPPTLRISDVSINGSNITPLNYRYQVTLNSAASMTVSAKITSNTGASLGTDGSYTHNASGNSPSHSVPLRWTSRPTTVTLTLTGTYTQNGQTKTVQSSQNLSVPEQPFTAPTLSIVSASLNGSNVSPLSYRYRVTLNSAQNLRVTAAVVSSTGDNLGSAGPYNHSASETSPTRSMNLSFTTRPSSVTLTLTGTYTQNGQTKTVSATQTLTVAEEPFVSPTLSITSASLNGSDVTPLTYRYQVTLNSAPSMSVTARVSSNTGASLGSGGPYSHTSSGSSPERSVVLTMPTTRPTTVTLTLTGSYTENGTNKTVTATQTLTVPEEVFTPPTLRIVNAAINGQAITPLTCSYQVTLNSAASMQVTARVTSNTNAVLGSAGAYNHTSSGTSPTRTIGLTWTTVPSSVTLTLTGTYTEKGTTKTVTATQTLQVPPFEDPTLQIDGAHFVVGSDSFFLYKYTVDLQDATLLKVEAAFTYEEENDDDETVTVTALEDGPYEHSVSETTDALIAMVEEELPGDLYEGEPITLTLTGTYRTPTGEIRTLTATREVELFYTPALWISDAQFSPFDDSEVVYTAYIYLYDVDEFTVNAELQSGSVVGTAGPYEFTEDGDLTQETIKAEESLSSATLLLRGSYELEGMSFEVTDSYDVTETMPFEEPTISIRSAERLAGSDEVRYTFAVDYGSADYLKVTPSFEVEMGNIITGAPIDCNAGTFEFGPYTTDVGMTAYTLKLTGSYEFLGKTLTVVAQADIAPPFIEPTFRNPSGAIASNFSSFEQECRMGVDVNFDLGSAESLSIHAEVYSDLGTLVGTSATIPFSSGDFFGDELILNLTGDETSLTVKFFGDYQNGSTTGQITAETEVIITMGGYSFTCEGDIGWWEDDDGEAYTATFWAWFSPATEDPHKANYDFAVTSLVLTWYDDDEHVIKTQSFDSSLADVNIYYNSLDEEYEFTFSANVDEVETAVRAKIDMTVTDQSTGKTYDASTGLFDI